MQIAYPLWHTLGDDGNRLDLRELHELHGGLVDGTGRSKVDNSVDLRVLGNGLLDVLVYWKEGLAGSPVHLADELTTEGVDDTGNRGGLALADVVEVKHTLHGSWLETAMNCIRYCFHLIL